MLNIRGRSDNTVVMACNYFETADHAAIYRRFRPNTSEALVERVLKYVREKFPGPLKVALDVGCGSGQSTEVLAPSFSEVYGVDVSETAINEAIQKGKPPNLTYCIGPAEKLNFADNSVTLVTAGQAFHWFNIPVFLEEVKRILAPGGALAVYTYVHPLIEYPGPNPKDLSPILEKFFYGELGEYWAPEFKIAVGKYDNIDFPLEDITRDESLYVEVKATLTELLGHASSWSGFQNYLKKNGKEKAHSILMDLEKELLDAAGSNSKPEETDLLVRHNYFLLLARKAL